MSADREARATGAVRIQAADFDLSSEIMSLRSQDARVGAVVSFVGTVRDMNDGLSVVQMELEHYPGMTEQAIELIVAQALARWPLFAVRVIHRVGPLQLQDQIVLVACTSAHRGDAFAACEFIIDYLKTDAPLWKKEQTPEGTRWVDARVTDEQALEKWVSA